MRFRAAVSTFALAALSLLGATVAIVADTEPVRADPTSDTLRGLASCLHERHSLSVVLLVDTSGSLKTTDPRNDRIGAARLALANFASLAAVSDGGRTPEIEVLLAGFASTFDIVVPWTPLTPDSLGSFAAPLDSFATRNDGIDTDFPTALIGAQSQLDGRGDRTCRAVLLFTDGKYDVVDGNSQRRRDAGLVKVYAPDISLAVPGSGAQVEALGRDFLCRPDGLADTMRSTRVRLITVALAVQIEPADQQFLRALSERVADGTTCGTARSGTGAYLPAAQLSELKRLFNRVTTAIAGGTEVGRASGEVEVCPETACDAGRRSFPVDAAAERVSFLVDTGATGVDATITLPDGGEVTAAAGESGSETVDGIEVRWTWVDERTVNVEAELPAGRSTGEAEGEWDVTLVQPDGEPGSSPARIDAYLYGGWAPALYTDAFLLEGVEQEVLLEIVDGDGDAVDANDYTGTVEVTGTLAMGESEATALEMLGPDRRGRYSFVFEAPAESGVDTATLAVVLRITTPSGVALAPADLTAQLPVRRPDVYPTIASALVDAGTVRGTDTAVGAIEIVGGRDRTGCAWVRDVEFTTLPDGVGSIGWSSTNASEAKCQTVLAGSSEAIDLDFTPENSGSGAVQGTVTVEYLAGRDTEIRGTTVPLEFRLLPPIDQGRRAGLFVGIMLLGLLAPIGALFLLNRSLARFQPTDGMLVARIPIAARSTFNRLMAYGAYDADEAADARLVARLAPDGSLAPLVVTDTDLHPCAAVPSGGMLQHDELTFHARIGRNPFAAPYGEVESARPIAVGPRPGAESTVSTKISLAVMGHWIITLPADPVEVPEGWMPAEILVYVAGRDLAAELAAANRTIGEQAGRLTNVLTDLDAGRSTVDRATTAV